MDDIVKAGWLYRQSKYMKKDMNILLISINVNL